MVCRFKAGKIGRHGHRSSFKSCLTARRSRREHKQRLAQELTARRKHLEEQIKQAKRLLAERKYSHQEIANATSMTKSAVSELSCGRRRKHIEAYNENKTIDQ